MEMVRNRQGRTRLSVAREMAEELTSFISLLPGVKAVETAGSTRRWKETVGDLDIIAGAENPEILLAALASHPRVKEVINKGDNRIEVMTWWGIAVDLSVVTPAEFIPAWHRATGSKTHYLILQEIAKYKGLKLNHRGIETQEGKVVDLTSEADIYRSLGMEYIPPELRENRGEIEAATGQGLPKIISGEDIKGDLHIHTTWSDSAMEIKDVVNKCLEKGYSYAAITDHSRSLKVANGLELERVLEQHQLIRQMNTSLKDFTLLTGVEMDILPDGSMDFPDELLEQTDVVIASVHTGFRQSKQDLTKRFTRAMENPNVDIIAHMTGRVLGRRESYELDVEALIEMAAKTDTVLEINASPDRLDLNEEHTRMAKEAGAKLAINTDAHDVRRWMKWSMAFLLPGGLVSPRGCNQYP
nr:DNA polymerase/3'-5' exonuclease PolX [Desulforamulus aquiferis]